MLGKTSEHKQLDSISVVSVLMKSANFLREKQMTTESTKSLGFILWGPGISIQNVMPIHQVGVNIFQSAPKWWTNQLTDKHTDIVLPQSRQNNSIVLYNDTIPRVKLLLQYFTVYTVKLDVEQIVFPITPDM